ncbi:MAG TPA: metalloregulator ArsR/SmtB family transcription factor [Mycobacterium sp.]|uniref:ArsR/SmtB family transcription factor n=1 Tax=Mycobacterium sp. TaxID=1785 RepID=UPI002D677302|nr:metalloregulator ArsR/SmtB family transcription factor [Mycobacterium sp.]HXY64764.1 metalloregulator ArsR/SmtB family transcription factor [Mycobacterium sp.]
MPPRAKAGRTDIVFAALANPTRRDILDMLLGGERAVVALAERFDMARPSVSEHLKVLRDCGLVAEDKHGRFRHYRVNPGPLQEISKWLSPHERYWRERLTALGEVLDDISEQEDASS